MDLIYRNAPRKQFYSCSEIVGVVRSIRLPMWCSLLENCPIVELPRSYRDSKLPGTTLYIKNSQSSHTWPLVQSECDIKTPSPQLPPTPHPALHCFKGSRSVCARVCVCVTDYTDSGAGPSLKTAADLIHSHTRVSPLHVGHNLRCPQ